MAYTTIDKPTDYFNTVLYTGNGSNGHAITGVGFQPDWVWLKNRSAGTSHVLVDAVRGNNKVLSSNNSGAETTTNANKDFRSFDSDGFTVDTNENFGSTNTNGANIVAWNWKANGSASSNSNGSITSSVSANTTAGFSIVSYTGNETAGDTVGHGLGSVPAMFIVKKTSSGSAQNWFCYHASLGAGYEILLNSSNASDTTSQWNSTAPTSSLFTLGNSSFTNASGATYIAYCFAEKKGYSKFGSYTGNGNADGTFVYTGFKPAFLIIKKTSAAGSWYMYDNKRAGGSNVNDDAVLADTNDAEFSSNIDFLSNGVKIRTSGSGENLSGGSFIYMCFAESPFTTSTGIPTTAR
nr:hypothetical protein [uncultured Mediterranean phage uvMED]